MNSMNFDNVLWQSKCNAGKLLMALSFAPLIFFISIFFAMHFFGFCPLVIILIVLTVGGFVFIMIYGNRHRWMDPQLIFIFTDQGLIFTKKNNDSFFFNEYENISDYSYVKNNEKYTTVTFNFHKAANAGAYGKLRSLKMFKIKDFDILKQILEEHEIPCLQEMKMEENN